MPTQNLPDVFYGVAFNADPLDPAAVPSWTDLTARCLGIDRARRGRQYELDQNRAGDLAATWRNTDEALNPANTGSPYAPNVVPGRLILARAMWPNGGTGNLINTAAIGAPDPAFESYVNGAAAPAWLTAVGGVAPTITMTNPQQGTKDVTYTVAGTATVQGLSWVVPCIPGRQYTASAYVRQSSASTQQISVVGGAAGTSTATTGAYVRLSVTFTATQPSHTVQLATVGTALAGTVNVDALQHEPGGTANAFTTTGPIIRNIWPRGTVERWTTWWAEDSGGFDGRASTPSIGPLGLLAKVDLYTEIRNSILAKSPAYYWPLQEPAGSTVFANASGVNGQVLVRRDGKYGPSATVAPGTATNLAGDPGGVGVKVDQPAVGTNSPGTVLQAGYGGVPPLAIGGPVPYGFSIAAWVAHTGPLTGSGTYLLGRFGPSAQIGTSWSISAGTPDTLSFGGGSFSSITATDNIGDGKLHLLVQTVDVTAGTSTMTAYVDGVSIGSSTSGTEGTNWNPRFIDRLELLGFLSPITGVANAGIDNSVMAHAAVWNRVLSAAEVTDLYNAGAKGYAGETSGARIARYLSYGYAGPTSIQTGGSVMGAATATNNQSLTDGLGRVADSEFGNLFEGSEALTFASRGDRYLKTVSMYTFGERVDLGEYPYEGDITFDLDPTQVINVADITRSGGIKAHAEDAASKRRNGSAAFTRTIDVASDYETIDQANWVVYRRKTPLNRISSVTFHPAAVRNLPFGDGTLWPMVLTLEEGTRVTVKRRPKAANAGAGITQTGDFFVEQIEHHGIDPEAGEWFTTVWLSPADKANPWILDDATYSVLGTTTILAA